MDTLKKVKFTLLGAALALIAVLSLFFISKLTLSPKPSSTTDILKSERITFKEQSFDVVRFTPGTAELRLFWKDEAGEPYGSFESLRESLKKEGKQLHFATNAGIFSKNNVPGGLHIEDGKALRDLNLRDGFGNFHMKPNGVFIMGSAGANVVESGQYEQLQGESIQIATQSGPMLVQEGVLHPDFNEGSSNRFIRNGVGVDNKGNIWFAISNEKVNFFDFATLFRDQLDCPNALYLDGSISAFFLPGLERYDSRGGFCGILAVVE